jgi:hypothetical protein
MTFHSYTLESAFEQLRFEFETRYEPDRPVYIAVDANPYDIRIAVTAPDGLILDQLQAKPHQTLKVVNFLRRQRRMFPRFILTGARKDRWPPGLLPALVMEFGPVTWAPEDMIQEGATQVRKCTDTLRFFRSKFIALCAAAPCYPEIGPILDQWKRTVVWELMLDLELQPRHRQPVVVDDIPF